MPERAPQRLSAGIVVARTAPRDPVVLMLRAYRNWDFPKGTVEPGEEPLAAAIRETAEESGITDLAFDWGTDFYETGPYSGNKIARYYLARTRTERVVLGINPLLRRPEHHEYRWVELDAALALAAPRVQPVIGWVARKLAEA
jgi:bis(5'-nucleosidyl)-tetraphosphatase